MADNIPVDSEGNPQIDFVWGGMAPQPNAERDIPLDPKLGDHPIYDKGYSGYPSFKTEAVDNAPGVDASGEPDVVEPGSPRAVSEAGSIKVSGEGVQKSEAEVRKIAQAKKQAALDSVAEQHGIGFDPHPVADVETPDRTGDRALVVEGDEVPTPLSGNKLTARQEKAAAAQKAAASTPDRKTVVMTPAEAIKAREALGEVPQAGDLGTPVAPVTKQELTGQAKVKENHNPDSEPGKIGEAPELPEKNDVVPVDQHPDRVEQTPAAKDIAGLKQDQVQNKPTVSRKADAKAPTTRVPEAKADQIKVAGAGDTAVVDPDTQQKDPERNPAAQGRQGK